MGFAKAQAILQRLESNIFEKEDTKITKQKGQVLFPNFVPVVVQCSAQRILPSRPDSQL
jgi:hypothetical protein